MPADGQLSPPRAIARGAAVELLADGESHRGRARTTVVSALDEGVVVASDVADHLAALQAGVEVTLVATADIRPAMIDGEVVGASEAGVAVRLVGSAWRPAPAEPFPVRADVCVKARLTPLDSEEAAARVAGAITSRTASLGRAAGALDETELTLSQDGLCAPLPSGSVATGIPLDVELSLPFASPVSLRALARVERLASEVGPRHVVARFEVIDHADRLALGRYLIRLRRAAGVPRPAPSRPVLGSPVTIPFEVPRLEPSAPTEPAEGGGAGRGPSEEALAGIFEALEGLYEEDTLEGCVRLALDVAAQWVPCRASAGFVMVPSYEEMLCIAVKGRGLEWLLGRPVPTDGTAVGLAATAGGLVAIDDAREDPRVVDDVNFVVSGEARALLAAPITSEGRIFGAVELVNRRGGGPFDEAEVNVLEYVAGTVSAYVAGSLSSAALRGRLLADGEHED